MKCEASPSKVRVATKDTRRRQLSIWGQFFLGILGPWLVAIGLSRFSQGPIPVVDSFISIGPLVLAALLLLWVLTHWFREARHSAADTSQGTERARTLQRGRSGMEEDLDGRAGNNDG